MRGKKTTFDDVAEAELLAAGDDLAKLQAVASVMRGWARTADMQVKLAEMRAQPATEKRER